MERTIADNIKNDLDKKIIIITGARQVGKQLLQNLIIVNLFYWKFYKNQANGST